MYKKYKSILAIMLYITAYVLMGYYVNWQACLSLFLFQWGLNIEKSVFDEVVIKRNKDKS